MNKQRLIIILVTGLLFLAALGVAIFAKGTIVVKSNIPITSVTVDGKIKTLSNDMTALIPVGSRHIVVGPDYYNKTETTVFIFPWVKKPINVYLSPNSDGEKIIEIAKIITEYSTTFSAEKNVEKYLSSVKKYVNNDTYNNLLFEIEESIASQTTLYPIDVPVVVAPTHNVYIEKIGDRTIATVETTKTSNSLSLSNMQYDFEKISGSWIITNIIYNE